MKILIFSPYYPPHTGGLESHAAEFNNHLSNFTEKIWVFTPQLPQNTPENEIINPNIEIIRFPAFEIIPNYPIPKFWKIKFWKLLVKIFHQNPDIIVSRTRFFLTSLLALLYVKIKKKKLIHIEHGSDYVQLSSQFKTNIAKIYDWTFGLLVFRFSNQNIAISQAVKKFILKFDQRSMPVIYRGLETKEIDKINKYPEIDKQYPNKTILVFVGRLYKWKGVENSILAVKSLPKELKEKIVFLIIGDGEDFFRLQKLTESENCIKMLGNLPREKVWSILKSSDIYLHSANPGGGLSTSLLEAMYCRCAVIATPNEGADEVIENQKNGLLIKKSEPQLISQKIQELLAMNSLESYQTEAQQTVENKFKWESSIKQYEKIFKNVLQ